jgi:hypothetical protein
LIFEFTIQRSELQDQRSRIQRWRLPVENPAGTFAS